MKKLHFKVKRGNAVGTILRPHVHADGCFVVSMTRFQKDYIRVGSGSDLSDWVAKGYRVRMSNVDVRNHRSPSLIAPNSIEQQEV